MLLEFKKNTKRISRAAFVSLAGFAATTLWFGEDFSDNRAGTRKQVAVLVKAVNEVERRPEKRVIWQKVEESEPLYAGEAIRTSDIAEASIKFIETGTQIELEPDSLIILEEHSGQLALNFLKGNLFVSEGGRGQLRINSGNKTVKTEDLQNSGGVISAVAQAGPPPLKVLSPTPHQPVYFNPAAGEKIAFTFEKTEPGYTVILEAGSTPKKLKPVNGATVDGETGALQANVKVGTFYWRLIAKSSNPELKEKISTIQKNESIAKVAPSLLEPGDGLTVVWNSEDPSVNFRWSNLAKLESMVLEVSKTKDMKNPLVNNSVDGFSEMQAELKETGEYYWRVAGQMRGTNEKLSSTVQKFKFKREIELLPPTLLKPAANERMSHQILLASKLSLKWEGVDGIERYRVSVKPDKGEPFSEELNLTELRLNNLQPGTYTWSVVSIDKNGKQSTSSPERKFFVDSLPKLAWLDGQETPLNHFYMTEKPSLAVSWQNGPPKTKTWKIRFTEDGKSITEAKWSEPLTTARAEVQVDKTGKYEVEVEAFDETGMITAKSGKRVITIQQLPLLPPPEFGENVPDKMQAKNNGSFQVDWKPVAKAQKYVVEIKNESGATVKETTVDRTSTFVPGLMPGQYNVVLKSVDQTGRRGPASEARPLLVPDRSDAKAPKIKAIKVK